MPIVTLTTDFGTKDYYVGLLKGALLCLKEDLNIVDITHNIKNYDIVQAAYIFNHVWNSFPKGTIHILSVDDFSHPDNGFVVFEQEGHYFIGPDNGVFSLVFPTLPTTIYAVQVPPNLPFPLKSLLTQAVGAILRDPKLEKSNFSTVKAMERITLQPVVLQDRIRGSVIHIDKYENVIVNINRELFQKIGQERPFSLFFKRHDPITMLSKHYYDVPVGEILCLFNSANFIEIAVNKGKASSLFGLHVDDTIQIDFHKPPITELN